MTAVRFRVMHAGPVVTHQDGGRPGLMRFGVPASGPMDRLAHAAANVAVGNSPDATCVEISAGGLTVELVDGAVTAAVAGGGFDVRLNADVLPSWGVVSMSAGDRLTIRTGAWGSWAYLAVAGDIAAHRWLGHTATHSQSGLGGGAVLSGDTIVVERSRADSVRDGALEVPSIARPAESVRVVLGPQQRHIEAASLDRFASDGYRVSAASDRMGVRLDGTTLTLADALSIPSEPIVRGSIQVAGDGVPTVLLADHQTTGGYPKIATIISPDIDRFAQRRPGDIVRFEPVDPGDAVAAARGHAAAVDAALAAAGAGDRTVAQRLASANLIGGAHVADPH